jgi:predicted cation transporter
MKCEVVRLAVMRSRVRSPLAPLMISGGYGIPGVASQKVVAKQSGKAAISFCLWVVLIQKLALAPAQATQKR